MVDENDRLLFAIPLRNCMFDVRYRNGQLRFRENGTGREGFVDRNGNVTFFSTGTGIPSTVEQEESSTMAQAPGQSTYEGGQNSGKADRSGSMTDGDLKQMALARMTESNTNYVSQTINSTFGKNFRSFVNEYRIKVAMKRMMDNEHYGNYSIQGISESVGYKSASNFIAAFKKMTGMTPSLYQKISKSSI